MDSNSMKATLIRQLDRIETASDTADAKELPALTSAMIALIGMIDGIAELY